MRHRLHGLTLILAVALPASAGDLTTGYTFVSGEQNVTHTKLNNQVNNAVINTSFFTDKSAVTTAASADTLLLYSSGNAAFRRITVGSLLYNNATLITGATEDPSPAAGDFLLTYDVSDAGLKKATLTSVVFENAALINARTNWSTPDRDTFFLAYDSGAWSKVSRTNLTYQFFEYATFTNQPAKTALATNDVFLIWDATAATNKTVTFSNLTQGVLLSDTNQHLSRLQTLGTNTLLGLSQTGTNAMLNFGNYFSVTGTNLAPNRFSTNCALLSTATFTNVPHGLGRIPAEVRVVIVCETADNDFVAGDEVDGDGVQNSGQARWFAVGANATNVFLGCKGGSDAQTVPKIGGALANLTEASWRVKLYAW